MKSQTLWMGTGPLFSFGMASKENRDFGSASVGWMETGMEFCSLVNMSSRLDGVGDFGKSGKGFGSVVQRIVGSSIYLSSNHDRGTGMLDVNLGGSLRCVNTSFFSCVREGNSETAKSESFTEFVQNDRFSLVSDSTIASVSYTLCSFNEMTASLGNPLLGGAAICLFESSASFTIDQCFFHKCTVTASQDDGGAVFVRYSSSTKHPVEITNSSFTQCKTVELSGNCGGGFCCLYSSQFTLDSCFFESCTAQHGGAAYFSHSSLTLSNCAFVLCSSSVEAGTLYLYNLPSIDLSFLQFRECKCTGLPVSKDIYFRSVSSEIANSDTIKFCDSTSGSPNVYFLTGTVQDSTLVPQLTEEQKTGISSFEVSMGEDTATITIRTTKEVKGTMGVLLEGSSVPRLVHVSFGTSATKSSIGTVEVSIGLEGVLPILSEATSYTIRSASIPGWPIDTMILSVSAKLEGTREASFKLTGCFLKTGTYSMKVKDSENNDFAISLSLSSGSLTGTSPLSSTDSTKLKYEVEYEVVEVLCDSQKLFLATSFSFSIPYPPATLTGIDQTDGNDSMTIGFVGTGFVASVYKVRVTEVGVEEPSTLTVDLLPSSESRLTEWTAKLYPFSEADLKYGTEYEVSSVVSLDGKQTVTTSSLTFETPVEPSRVTSVSFTRLSDSSKKAEVAVEGRAMSSEETYTLHLNETATQTPAKMNVSFSSSTNGKGTALLFSLIDSEIELKYDTNYTVVNVTDSSNNAVLFTSGLTFKTDIEPTRLVSFSIVGLDSGGKRVLFSMSGRALNSNEIYLVELSESRKTRFTVEMKMNEGSGKWEGSGVVYPVLGAELGFGERLDVKSFRKQGGSTDLLSEGGSVTISAEPSRLVSVMSSDEDGLNGTTLTVETRALEVGEEYTLTLSGTPLSSPSSSNTVDTRTIRFTATTETSYVFTLSLYPLSSAKLLFGHTYSASWMAIGSNASILIETAECSFSTPVKPERLVSVSAANFGSTSLNSTIELSFSSRALLPSTEYTLTFTSSGSPDEPSHSKTMKLTTTENGVLESHVAVLYPFEKEISKRNSQFEFERTYVLSSFERGSTELLFDTEMISFVIPKESTRIEKCVKAELNKDRTVVRLFFEGRALHSAMGFIWLKDGSTFWSSVSPLTATDSTHCLADFIVSSSESVESLKFGKEYTVSIETGEPVGFLLNDGINTRIPFPPRLLSASFAFTNSLLTSCSVSFVGSDLPVGKDFRVTLSPSLSFVIGVIDAEIAKSSQLRIGWPDSLQFSTNYTISSIVGLDEDDGEILFDPSLSFETEAEPARIIRCVSSVLSVDGKTLTVQLEGRALDGNIGRVCLTRNGEVWESIDAMTVESTTLSVAEFRVGEAENEGGLGIGNEYTLIGMSDGSSGCVVEEGIRIVVPRKTVMCRKGGSGEAEKCGQPSNPCSSLLVGWMAGLMQQVSSEGNVELEVDREVEIGRVVFVEEKKIRVWGGSKGRGRVLVEWRESWESMNAIEVDGGQASIEDVTILLGEGGDGGMGARKSFLICGGGEVNVGRVVVGSVRMGRVGMGLVGLWWGSATLASISMEGIEFGDGVRFVEVRSEKKVASLSLCSMKTRRVQTLNAPLISFSCGEEESEVKMEKVILLETTREESGDRLGDEEGGVMFWRRHERRVETDWEMRKEE